MTKIKRRELYYYAAFWALTFIVIPLISLPGLMSGTGRNLVFTDVLSVWANILPFLALFLVHNLLLYPLLERKKKAAYAVLLAVLVLVWGLWCFALGGRPAEPQPHGGPGRMPGSNPPPAMQYAPEAERRPAPDRPEAFPDRAPDQVPFWARVPLRPEYSRFFIGLLLLGVSFGAKSVAKLRQREQDIAQLERENLRRQLESLHFQINPHFFMNTMNNIQALILTDPEKAAESIEQLSDMMRITLSNGSREVVPLADEICFLQDYVALMRLRYSERVSIETVFPGETADAVVPPLAIATLMENAFKHGIRPDADSFVHLDIEITGESDRRIICRCCNSLPGEKGTAGLGIGLDNVRQRLALIYGERFSLINEPVGGQYLVRLEIPAVA